MTHDPSICLLTDAPDGASAQHLGLLYPGCVTVLDYTQGDHDVETLRGAERSMPQHHPVAQYGLW